MPKKSKFFDRINVQIFVMLLILFSFTTAALGVINRNTIRRSYVESFTERVLLTNALIATVIDREEILYYTKLLREQDNAFKERQANHHKNRETYYRMLDRNTPENELRQMENLLDAFMRETQNYKDSRYWELVNSLLQIRDACNATYVYVIADTGVVTETGEKLYTFIFDADDSIFTDDHTNDGLGICLVGESSMDLVYETKKSMDRVEYYSGEYGELYYAYAPILDDKGEVIAVLGTDLDLEKMNNAISASSRLFSSISLLFFIFMFLFIYLFLRRSITEPLGSLTNTARELALGNVYFPASQAAMKQRGEIGMLANAINDMSMTYQDMISSTEKLFDAANIGKLDVRNDASKFKGDIRGVIKQINNALDATTSYLNSIPESIFIMSMELEIFFRNEQFARCFGDIEAIEFISNVFPHDTEIKLSHQEKQAQFSKLIEETLINENNNTVAWINDLCYSIIFKEIDLANEHKNSILVIAVDITNMMNRTSEMETIMNNYKGVIWRVDKDGTITSFKGQYLKVIGVTPDFLEGKKLDLARLKNRHLDIIDHVEKTFHKGPQDWVGDIGDGVFHSHTAPVYDVNAQVVAVVGSTDDITETVHLQKDLEIALRSAEAASRAKSDFLANMSHEIRTPMNAIIGMTNIAKSTNIVERKDYALEKIQDASNHLLGVINDILDMSKIEADKLELHPEPFNFEEMLKKTTNIINFPVVEKHIRLAVYIDRNIPRILICDSQRLAQVITNLLSNAVKFTPENGAISIKASLFKEENGIYEIRFDVTDTGVGITEEQQSRLFKPFEQAETSTTRKYGGTGLGLAITKRVVELMGGNVTVSSVIGKGSTFTFSINAEKGVEDADSLSVYANKVTKENIRILIVDDDKDILEYFTDIAKSYSIACDTAIDGQEALALLKKQSYDICFVDWKMPGMNGIELSRRISKIDSYETIIIMISSVEWQEIADEAKDAGINKFLPKPIFPSAFIECINTCFSLDLVNENNSEKSEKIDYFEGYRVLLAEDVEINREIVLALLEPTLLSIDCAENGVEAVRKYSEAPEKYNIIFMDLQMPKMDGYEATQAIRALDNDYAKTVPIIAMTANVFKEDVDNCIKAGMNDHLGKPLDFDAVLKVLRQYLYKQKPSGERRKRDRRKTNDDRRNSERRKKDRRIAGGKKE